MGGQPQILHLGLEHGEPCVAQARVAQYPYAIIETKVDLVFGFEIARFAFFQLVKDFSRPGGFPKRCSFGFETDSKSKKRVAADSLFDGRIWNLESRQVAIAAEDNTLRLKLWKP